MSHTIFVHNKSGHDQEFEVHGWNNNQNITVGPNATTSIDAPDGSSGAIIALHDGHEGEQAEITKNGFGGNDFIDLSNIVGAGGNMTVMQVDDRSTLKGDPNFMQDFNNAWHAASDDTRNGLSNCVHLDGNGNVSRIDAIKDYPNLESFVRSFANGMTYIGVGAWAGNPGNPNDNNQSSAAHGNKDIMVTYNDGNANPDDNSGHSAQYTVAAGDTFWSISQKFGLSVDQLTSANPGVDVNNLQVGQTINLIPRMNGMSLFMSFAEVAPSNYTIAEGDTLWSISQRFGLSVDQITSVNPGIDANNLQVGQTINLTQQPSSNNNTGDDGSPGIILTNKSSKECNYFFYDNFWNGNGTAGANFDKPLKNIVLASNQTQFVSLPTTFKGRVQRGTQIPCTWVEFQIEADNDHAAHGDISVEQGNDGGAWIRSTDGRDSAAGFSDGDIGGWGPGEAYQTRQDGVRALASTMGNWLGGPNQAAIDCQQGRIGSTVYVTGGSGIPDVASNNKRFAVEFY